MDSGPQYYQERIWTSDCSEDFVFLKELGTRQKDTYDIIWFGVIKVKVIMVIGQSNVTGS